MTEPEAFYGELGETYEIGPVPQEYDDLVEEHRGTTVMAAAEVDEELEELVIMEETYRQNVSREAIRKATLEGHIQPAFAGSALPRKSVQALLDGILELFPSPLQRPPSKATTLEGESVTIPMTDEGSLLALAFKVQMWEGEHVFARIYRGVLNAGDKMQIMKKKKKNVWHVFLILMQIPNLEWKKQVLAKLCCLRD